METNHKTNNTEEAREQSASESRYRIFMAIAIVAGVFSLIVCILLLVTYIQDRAADPLDSTELIGLKAELFRDPGSDPIRNRIRTLDLQLRKEYFRRSEFASFGSYLLIGGIAVFLIGIKSALTYRKKLPMPAAASPDQDEEARNAIVARWSVGIFGLVFGIAALALMIFTTSIQYPEISVEQLAASTEQPTASIQQPASSSQQPALAEVKKNWPRFRGPGGLGISAYTNIPSSWDGKTGEGILWKIPIPLPGNNSPVVWGDRIFLTGATEEKREVYCVDANSGNILWQKAVENVPFSSPEPPEVSDETGFAAPTAVTDGQQVYAIFANGDTICFDFNGKQIWARNFGPFDNMYGHSSSLAMYQNLLLVLIDQGGADDGISELLALEATTGRTIWTAGERPVPNSWASPIVINTGERDEIITCGAPWVIAYDPATGSEFWRADCLSGDVAPSPVYGAGLVFATNAYAFLAAIRPGGQGDVTETHIVWAAEDGLPDICSPLANEELVFVMETYGLMTCYDAKDGTKVWEEDLVESFNASPSLVGDNVYLLTEDGIMIIIKASREFQKVGRCELGEDTYACPAFMDGRIYIRGEENLYCIVKR